MNDSSSKIIGGGFKKVLYTINTVKRMGLKKSAKALTANNACKACALGMGGQRGGMVNELDEYPSVCNKSIQAQSTDIQQPIPIEAFSHSIKDFKELSAKELEHLGRLANPIFKGKDSNHYQVVDWNWAMNYAIQQFKNAKPEQSFFYSSGRSSNEAGFILQLLARLYGTNNVSNCSYYCHQATGVGLANSIGSGTATVEINDLTGCDLVFLIGANPSSNHPRLIHKLKDLRDRGGHVIVINPAKEPGLVKFAVPKSPKSMLSGGTDIASLYIQPNIGSDLWVLKGIAKAVLEKNGQDQSYINQYTTGFEQFLADISNINWPDIIQETAVNLKQFQQLADLYIHSHHSIFAWGMGVTHHVNGVDNVEYIANLALLRGMIGKQFAGLLPLRGHSNVQGIGTIGVKPVLPQEIFDNIEQNLQVSLPSQSGMHTLESLQAADNHHIKAALIMGGNLYAASPDSQWTEQAMDKINFKLFLTTTLNQGHLYGHDNSEALILPVTARDEEWQPTTQESMFNYVRLSDGGINRLDNVRPESVILSDLGQGLLNHSPIDFTQFKQHQHVREVIANVVPGMEKLANIDIAKQEFHIKGRLKHQPEFNTASNKASFNTRATVPYSASAQNYFKEDRTRHIFRLSTVRSEGQFNTIIYEESDSYRGSKNRWCILMNPTDMELLSLNNQEKVDVESSTGKMQQVDVIPFNISKGNVLAYFPEANVLVSQAIDPRSKTPAFKNITVAITLHRAVDRH